MYKVKQLYVKIEDNDGHTYLVRKEDAFAFEEQLEGLEESLSEHGDEYLYYDQFEDLLDMFGAKRLEGESHYVVLIDDVENV